MVNALSFPPPPHTTDDTPRVRLAPVVNRYVETELLSMKSLFEEKEAVLRQELSGDRERLVQEVESLRKQVEEATAGRIAAEVRFCFYLYFFSFFFTPVLFLFVLISLHCVVLVFSLRRQG